MMLRSSCESATLETMTNHTFTTVFETLWDAPMSNRGFVRFNAKRNTVTLQGLQSGKVTAVSIRPNPVLGGNIVVLHEEGGSYFVGRGMQGYAAASLQTVVVESEPRSYVNGEASYRYVVLSQSDEAKSSATLRQTSTAKVIERLGVSV